MNKGLVMEKEETEFLYNLLRSLSLHPVFDDKITKEMIRIADKIERIWMETTIQ